jgi:hypothetical protein
MESIALTASPEQQEAGSAVQHQHDQHRNDQHQQLNRVHAVALANKQDQADDEVGRGEQNRGIGPGCDPFGLDRLVIVGLGRQDVEGDRLANGRANDC